MVWIRNIEDLQFYNTPRGVTCYCETILKPSDMFLQGYLDNNANTSDTYSLDIDVLSADGTILIGNVTSYFDYYFARSTVNNRDFFVANLRGFPPEMCNNPCFILKVTVTNGGLTYFLYYTERYCIPSCCLTVVNVVGGQDGVLAPLGINTAGSTFFNPSPYLMAGDPGSTILNPTAPPLPANNRNDCGVVYMQMATYSDCYNAFSGRFYQAGSVHSGTPISYYNITNIAGRVVSEPAQFTRTYSINCRLQDVQMQRQYRLEGFELYPEWKMKELTDMITDKYIFINGVRYEANEGPVFEEVQIENECIPMYRLLATLTECNIRQIHGCGETCAANVTGFVIPSGMMSSLGFFSENKEFIGETCEDLAAYYQSQQGVTSVTIADPGDYDCEFDCAILVEALSDAYVPTSFYVAQISPQNRIYGLTQAQFDDLCGQITAPCAMPVVGTIEVSTPVCDTPVIGTIEIFTCTPVAGTIQGFGSWIQDVTNDISVACGTVVCNIDVRSTDYPYAGGDDPFPVIGNDTISLISENCRPTLAIGLTNADNSTIPVGASVMINPNGFITYSGEPTSASTLTSVIELTNLTWLL